VIVGPNGAGKSTLLKVLAGRLKPDRRRRHHGRQHGDRLSRPGAGDAACRGHALRRLRDGAHRRLGELKAELMSYHLFAFAPTCSSRWPASASGQKRKLQLALLMAAHANVLLLDEPTNHISLDVLEEFEAALLDVPRRDVLALSHDRRFHRAFCGSGVGSARRTVDALA
jgi:macrolide transport system ATP-binding/permease protein